jgi:hypothetical protein
MIIEAFIPDWDSPRTRASVLLTVLEQGCKTKILDSYDVPFSVQWEEAVSKFTGDIFLWAMADTMPQEPNRVGEMFLKMRCMYDRGDIAMYAPNVDWTSQVYNTNKLRVVEPNVFEVCGTDLVFASLSRELLELLPPLGVNTHAWGYDYLMTHIAHQKLGKKVVRDYNYLIDHPQGKAYKDEEAQNEMMRWQKGLPWEYQQGMTEQAYMQSVLCA